MSHSQSNYVADNDTFSAPLLYRTFYLWHLNESVHEGHRGLVRKPFPISNITLLRFKYIKCISGTSYLPSCMKYLTKSLLCKNCHQKLLSKQVLRLISPILQICTQNMKHFQVFLRSVVDHLLLKILFLRCPQVRFMGI